VEPCTCNALSGAHICDTDLVDQVTVRRDYRMVRLTSQYVDRARGLIILCVLVGKKRTGNRIGNPTARFVLV
jgi:hypothetical protein